MLNQEKLNRELSAAVYDQYETATDDVEFILSIVGDPPKKILEVACGSGRILVPLAKAGHTVTGFDMDEAMLGRIGPKAKGLANIHWYKADAIQQDWGTGFDEVILACNILFNIESEMGSAKAQKLFIQKAAAALVPGGHLYIGYSPYASNGRTLTKAGQSCEDDGSIVWSWEGTDDKGNFEKASITNGAFCEETGLLKFKRFLLQRSADGNEIRKETEETKHYASLDEIHRWLWNAGFSLEFEYENFQGKPIDENSTEVILYAKKN